MIVGFHVKAEYDEAIRMREELVHLRNEMMKVDATTEEGQRKMAALEQQYKETANALRGVAESAAQDAIALNNSFLGAEDSAVSLINTLQRGESVINGVFSSIKDQVEAANGGIKDSADILNATMDELQTRLTELTRERNFAEAQGDTGRADELREEIGVIQECINGNKQLHEKIDSLNDAYENRREELNIAIEAYESLADQQANVVDLTQEEADTLQKQLEEALNNVLDKISAFEESTGEIPDMLDKVKTAASVFRGGISQTLPPVAKLTEAQGTLGKASIEVAKNIARIVLPANAARVAVAALSGSFATAGIAVATILIKKLIDRYKEHKRAAEEAREAQEEFSKEVSKGAAPAIAKFEELKNKWMSLSTEMEKNEFIKENKKELEKLGVAVKNVDDAESLFIEHTKDYWDAQVARARVDLYRAKIQEAIRKQVQYQDTMEQNKNAEHDMQIKLRNGRFQDKSGEWHYYNDELGRQIFGDLKNVKPGDSFAYVNSAAYEAALAIYEITKEGGELDELQKKLKESEDAYNGLKKSMGGKEGDENYQKETAARKSAWVAAKAELERIKADVDAKGNDVKTAQQKLKEASDSYKEWTGIDPEQEEKAIKNAEEQAKKEAERRAKENARLTEQQRKEKEREAKTRADAIKRYEDQIKAYILQTEDSITSTQISAIKDNEKRTMSAFDLAKKQQLDKAREIGEAMTMLFQGNVDLLNRPQISELELAKKGWFPIEEVQAGNIATVYSSNYNYEDSKGVGHELLVTPILPDGSVLSESELVEYLDKNIQGADDFLKADTLGLVIAVDVDEEAGEKLHQMQELYYKLLSLIDSLDAINREIDRKKNMESLYDSIFGSSDDSSIQRDRINKRYDDLASQLKTEEDRLQKELSRERDKNKREELENELKRNQDAQKEAEKQRQKALFAADRNNGKLADALGDPSKKTTQEVVDSIDYIMTYMEEHTDLAVDEINTLRKALEGLVDSQTKVGPRKFITNILQQFADGKTVDDVISNFKAIWAAATPVDKTKMVAGWVGKIAGGMQMAANKMKEFAELTGDVSLAEKADQFSAVAQNFSAAAEGAAESGSWIGAVVGGVMDMVQQTYEAIEGAAVQTIIAAKNAERFAHAMQLAGLAIDQEKFRTIFGTDQSGMMQAYGKSAVDSLRAYEDELFKIQNTKHGYAETTSLSNGLSVFAAPLTGPESIFLNPLVWIGQIKVASNEFTTYKDAIERGYNELQAMAVKTKDNSGWANFWGVQDEYTALVDLAPQLWGEDGVFSVDNARVFLEENKQLSEEQRKQIQNVIDLQDAVNEAEKGLKDSLGNVFGNMSDQLTEMTINGLKSGAEIGSYEMKQVLGGAITDLQKQMVNGIYVRAMQSYQDDAFKLIKGGGNEEDLVAFYANMIDEISSTVTLATQAARHFEDVAREHGFEMDELDNVNGSQGSFQTISETTGSALEGRAASLQMSSEVRNQYLSIMNENVAQATRATLESCRLAEDIRSIQSDAYLAIVAIRDNTGNLLAIARDSNEKLTNIERKI